MTFKKSLTESERRDRFQQEKILKITEHVSFSSRYHKVSLLIHSGSNSLSNAGTFLIHPLYCNKHRRRNRACVRARAPQDFAINKEVPFSFLESAPFFLRKKCP